MNTCPSKNENNGIGAYQRWDGAQKNNNTEVESLEETYFNLEALPAFFWQLKEAISPP